MSSLVPKRAFLLPLSPLLLDLLLLVDAESKIPRLSSGELAAWELNLSNTDGGLRLPLLNLPSCFLSEFPDSFSALSVCLPSLSKTDIDSWLAPEDIAFFYFLRLTCFHLSLLGGRGGGGSVVLCTSRVSLLYIGARYGACPLLPDLPCSRCSSLSFHVLLVALFWRFC